MSAHTPSPGPWTASKWAVHADQPFKHEVASCTNISLTEDWCEANAHLIAAAPELLEALVFADNALALLDRSCGDAPTPERRCQECVGCAAEAAFLLAEAAIAKAKGQEVQA